MPVSEIVTATAAAIPAVNSLLDLLDRVSKMVKSGSNIEAREAVLELREAVLAVKSENLELKEQLADLRKSKEQQEQLRFESPNYYLIDGEGNKDGPYCHVCKDKEDKLIRIENPSEGQWHCRVCDNGFLTDEAATRISAERKQRIGSSSTSLNGPHSWMAR